LPDDQLVAVKHELTQVTEDTLPEKFSVRFPELRTEKAARLVIERIDVRGTKNHYFKSERERADEGESETKSKKAKTAIELTEEEQLIYKGKAVPVNQHRKGKFRAAAVEISIQNKCSVAPDDDEKGSCTAYVSARQQKTPSTKYGAFTLKVTVARSHAHDLTKDAARASKITVAQSHKVLSALNKLPHNDLGLAATTRHLNELLTQGMVPKERFLFFAKKSGEQQSVEHVASTPMHRFQVSCTTNTLKVWKSSEMSNFLYAGGAHDD
jgi:hypothetical protein